MMWTFADHHPVAAFWCLVALGMSLTFIAEQIRFAIEAWRDHDGQ